MLALVIASIVALQAPVARQVVQGVSSGVASIAVSRDGLVATLHADGSLRIWRLDTRMLIRLVPVGQMPGTVHPVELAWNERTHEVLLPAGREGVRAIDLEGHVRTIPGDADRLHAFGTRWLARDLGRWQVRDDAGTSVAAIAGSFGELVGTDDGSTAFGVGATGLVAFTGPKLAPGAPIALAGKATGADDLQATTLAASRDVAVACLGAWDQPKRLAIVDHPTARPRTRVVALGGAACRVALAPGVAIVSLVDEIVGVDLATATVRWRAPLALGTITMPEIAIHDRTALVTLADGRVRVYDSAHGEPLGELGHPLALPRAVWFAPNDRLVAENPVTSVATTTTWSLVDGTIAARTRYDEGLFSTATYAFHEDGTLAAARRVIDKQDACWTFSVGTLADGAPIGKTTTRDHWPPRPGSSSATCLAGREVVAAVDAERGMLIAGKQGNERVVRVGKPDVALRDVGGGIVGMTLELGGEVVLGYNLLGPLGTLFVWDAATGARSQLTADPKDGRKGFTAYAVAPDRRAIAVGGADTVTVYHLPDRKPVRTIAVARHDVSALALAPDGTVAIGTVEGDLALAPVRGPVAIVAGDGGTIRAVRIRGDGARIATISDDGGVRVWNPRLAALAATLVAFGDGEALATTPGGAFAGKLETAARIGWVFDGPTEGFTFERYATSFAHPEWIAKRLAGAADDLAVPIARPPRVTLAAAPPATTRDATLALRVHAETATGKVAEVRAFVDGRPRATATIDAAAGDAALAVPLGPGAQVVTVIAFDDVGRASNPTSFTIDAKIAAPRPDLWIVAVGVGWYPELEARSQLAAPVPDAHAIVDAFARQVGPSLPYAAKHVTLLEDERVTPASVDAALRGLAAMKPNDVAIVFFAGHGVKPPGQTEMVFLTSTAQPAPATWAASGVGWSAIGTALVGARGRVLVLLDACHAGHVTTEVLVPNTELADHLIASQRAGVFVFAASRGDQQSLEANAARGLELDDDQHAQIGRRPRPAKKPIAPSPPPPPPLVVNGRDPTAPRERGGEGYFTGAVVAALAAASTDLDRDGMIELSELVTQVEVRVVRASRGRQTPWVVRRELFGDYGLVRAAR